MWLVDLYYVVLHGPKASGHRLATETSTPQGSDADYKGCRLPTVGMSGHFEQQVHKLDDPPALAVPGPPLAAAVSPPF
jgi:hypothetical protein